MDQPDKITYIHLFISVAAAAAAGVVAEEVEADDVVAVEASTAVLGGGVSGRKVEGYESREWL